jgi:hypothetical protein
MTLVIRVTYSEFSESREVAFYAVQPRSISRQENKLYIIIFTPRSYFIFGMRTEVVKYYIELLVIERSYIFQELK